jgi:hypothetical protein
MPPLYFHKITISQLLDCKGLLCVGGALVYVESPIKVDSFFPFFKRVYSFFLDFSK